MNRTITALLASGLLFSSAGCAVSYSPDGQREQSNLCASDADCGSDAVCQASACISTRVDLRGLIVEVRPNSSASFGPTTSFLLTPDDALTQGTGPAGVLNHFDSTLPSPIAISGPKVKLGYVQCSLNVGSSYPAKITLERVSPSQVRGFHFDPITLTSKQTMSQGTISYEFDGEVSPGVYNVYIEPQPLPGCAAAPPPPVFFPGQDLSQQKPSWTLDKPTSLTGDIQTALGGDLDGYRLDIVEPDVGRVISMTQVLSQPQADLSVPVALDFVWPDKTISPYIRLRPPDDMNKPATKPTMYWDLVAALLGSSPDKPEVHLTVANLLVPPRSVDVQIQDQAGRSVPASVKIQSQQLFQTTAKVTTSATFGLAVPQTSPEGAWKASVPPGNYRVRVTPLVDDTLAITEADLSIPQETPQDMGCYCGHVITTKSRAVLRGDIATIAGGPLVGAPVAVEPSQTTSASFWSSVHALDPLLPRAASAVSDTAGGFAMNVDPGTVDAPSAVDVSVRPSEASGFPWLVKPRVLVQANDTEVDLAGLRIPAPAILEGTFTDPSGSPVASAYVHAWLPVPDATKNTGSTGTVIQIASTTTDAQGHYKLVLPAAISQ